MGFYGQKPQQFQTFYMGHILGKYKYHNEKEYCRNIRSYYVKESIIHDHDMPIKWISLYQLQVYTAYK